MATVNPIQKLRGTAAQNAAVTLPAGVIVYLTDTKQLAVHDGSTAGGTIYSATELQKVVASLDGVASTTTSTSWQTASSHTATITTKKASSKILIELTTTVNSAANAIVSFRREVSGGSSTNNITDYLYGLGKILGSAGYGGAVATVRYLDTPAVVGGTAVTYKLNFRSESGSSTQVGDSATVSTMTLTEIA
jgi:hypothetical protein